MQKFKVKRKDFIEAVMAGWSGDVYLEGELLEDGTVEELQTEHWLGDAIGTEEKKCPYFNEDCPRCHNKKEECAWCVVQSCPVHGKKEIQNSVDEMLSGKQIPSFNRETSKCTSNHVLKDGKCAVTDGVRTCVCKCSYCMAVPLPEMIEDDEVATEYRVRKTINAIINYLASKENK